MLEGLLQLAYAGLSADGSLLYHSSPYRPGPDPVCFKPLALWRHPPCRSLLVKRFTGPSPSSGERIERGLRRLELGRAEQPLVH